MHDNVGEDHYNKKGLGFEDNTKSDKILQDIARAIALNYNLVSMGLFAVPSSTTNMVIGDPLIVIGADPTVNLSLFSRSRVEFDLAQSLAMTDECHTSGGCDMAVDYRDIDP